MKILIALLLLTAATFAAEPVKNVITTQPGITLNETLSHIWVEKNYCGWGGPNYRVRVRDDKGKAIVHFVSDQPFEKTPNGWKFKVAGRNYYKEVSGNVEIGRL